jgi:hypothetical protein
MATSKAEGMCCLWMLCSALNCLYAADASL